MTNAPVEQLRLYVPFGGWQVLKGLEYFGKLREGARPVACLPECEGVVRLEAGGDHIDQRGVRAPAGDAVPVLSRRRLPFPCKLCGLSPIARSRRTDLSVAV